MQKILFRNFQKLLNYVLYNNALVSQVFVIIATEKYYTIADFKPIVDYFSVSNGKTDVYLICLCWQYPEQTTMTTFFSAHIYCELDQLVIKKTQF